MWPPLALLINKKWMSVPSRSLIFRRFFCYRARKIGARINFHVRDRLQQDSFIIYASAFRLWVCWAGG